MKYADPQACPACRGALSGGDTCPHCGFPLGSPQARRLWTLFQQADALVAQARSAPAAAPAAPSARRTPVVQRVTTPSAPVAAPASSWSTGSILLGLGAVCLVVAALIFATVAWGSLGILGRALILLVVTGAVGASAAWATRRRLLATAEALWAVFAGLVTVDVLAAVAEGLFGLAWDDFPVVSVVWTALLLGIAVAVVRWSRARIDHALVAPQLAAGIAPWISGPALAVRLGDEFEAAELWFWATLLALLIPLVVAAVAQRRRLLWALGPSALLATGFALLLVIMALTALLADSPVVTVTEALPLLVLVLLAAAGARFVSAARTVLSGAAAVLALVLLGVTVAGWAWALDVSQTVGLVSTSVAVAALAGLARGAGAVRLGLRWAAVAGGGAVLVWLAAVATTNLQRIDTAAWFSSPASVWVRPAEVQFREGLWVLAVIAPVLLAWLLARRWESPRLAPDGWWEPLAQLVGALAIVTAVAATFWPFLVHAGVLVAVGALLAVGLRRAPWPFRLAPPVVVAFSLLVVPGDAAVTAWAWSLAVVGFAVCALVGFDGDREGRVLSAVSAGVGIAVALTTTNLVLELSGMEGNGRAVVIVSLAAAVLLLSLALDELPWHRLALEVVAGLAFLVTVVGHGSPATVSLLCTIGAVACAVVGLLDDDRPYLRWVAVALVGGAWIARLVASDVDVVEAYTAPFAVVLLAVGAWRLHTDQRSRSWTVLAPGLTMALLPSLPQALGDPTSLRAALLGLLALLVLGAGVLLRWGAPVVAGASVALLIVLANVGPTTLGLPRWILIAAAGLVLLAVGTTWEKRVAEGRALVARISALR